MDADKTVGSVSIAGMDLSLTNDGGSTTWSIGTTVSGVALTLDSENDVTAAFGLAGNTLTVSHFGARAELFQLLLTIQQSLLLRILRLQLLVT